MLLERMRAAMGLCRHCVVPWAQGPSCQGLRGAHYDYDLVYIGISYSATFLANSRAKGANTNSFKRRTWASFRKRRVKTEALLQWAMSIPVQLKQEFGGIHGRKYL